MKTQRPLSIPSGRGGGEGGRGRRLRGRRAPRPWGVLDRAARPGSRPAWKDLGQPWAPWDASRGPGETKGSWAESVRLSARVRGGSQAWLRLAGGGRNAAGPPPRGLGLEKPRHPEPLAATSAPQDQGPVGRPPPHPPHAQVQRWRRASPHIWTWGPGPACGPGLGARVPVPLCGPHGLRSD